MTDIVERANARIIRGQAVKDMVMQQADTIATLQAKLDKAVEGLEWIEKTCREEIPLEYNDGMRKVFQRNIRDAAQTIIKELRT